MGYIKQQLERNRANCLSGRSDDKFRLHEYEGRTWLVMDDPKGDSILVVYNMTDDQLASLHAAIWQKLGLAPEATIPHIRQLHSLLADIVQRDDEKRLQSPFPE